MTIASEITNYANGLSDAYNAVNDMQGLIPQDKNMNNLDTAIRTIPQSTGPTYTAGNGIDITNDVISIDDTVVAELSDIPTVNDATLTITQNGTSAGTFTANSSTDTTIALTDTTYFDFTGATSLTDGAAGLVPKPLAGDETKFLSGNGQWTTVSQYNLPIASANDLGGIKVGTNLSIDSSTGVLDATDTTYSDFTGATSGAAGAHGLVPAPAAGDQGKALKGDGTWGDFSEKFVIMKYGEANAWSKFIDAYNNNKIVYCRASSNANPATGAQTRLAFMAYVNNETTPTEVEFQYVRSVSSKTSSQPVDQVFVYKLTSASGGTWTVQTRDMAPKIAAGTNASVSYSGGTYTISATDTTYSDFTGATSSVAGANGLVPAPSTSDPDKYLKGDGTWSTPPDTTYVDFVGADGTSAGTQGLVPAPAATDDTKFLKGDGTWDTVTFSLSPATTSTIGGVIVGNGISVASDGTISADTQAAVFTTNEWNAMWA